MYEYDQLKTDRSAFTLFRVNFILFIVIARLIAGITS